MAGRAWLHRRPIRAWPASPATGCGCMGPRGLYRRMRESRPIPRETGGVEGRDGRPGVVASPADARMARVTGDRVRLRGSGGTVPTDARMSADPASDRRSERGTTGPPGGLGRDWSGGDQTLTAAARSATMGQGRSGWR